MAQSFLTPINLNKLELQNPRFHYLTTGTAPASPVEGQFYYASDTHLPYVWNGTAWTAMVSAGTGFAAPAFTFSTTNSAGASANAIRSDATIALFDATAPTTSGVGDAAAIGTVAFSARRDHVHGREAFGAVTAQTTFGAASATGSATTVAHSDHTHGTPANPTGLPLALTGAVAATRYVGGTTTGAPSSGSFLVGDFVIDQTGKLWICTTAGTPGTWTQDSPAFGTSAITLGTAATAGSATTALRTDATIVAFDTTAPTTSAVADAAAVGTAVVSARRDHTHGREAFGAPTAQLAFGAASATGTAVTIPHSDHTHGTPTHDDTAHAAIHLNALAAATAAYSMGGFKLTNLAAATVGTDAASLANRLDQFAAPNTTVGFGGFRITNVADPTISTDAATKNYVDNVAQGLSPKGSVTVATTGILPGTYTYANGAAGVGATLTAPAVGILTVDGVALVLNNRVLVKNEAAPANNGIYFVSTAGTASVAAVLTRTLDEDDASEVPGAFAFVEAGTANAATGWVIANAGPFTVGTTAQTFTQFSGAGTYTGTANSITLTGNAFSISATYVGQTSITTLGTITSGTWTGTTIAVANGGTGSTSAAAARGSSGLGSATAPTGAGSAGTVSVSNTGIPTKVIATVGDGAATAITVTHNLGTRDVAVDVYRSTTPWDLVVCDVNNTTINSVTLTFAVAPTASQYNAVIIG